MAAAMATARLTLAVISQARTIIMSLKNRIFIFFENPETYRILTGKLECLTVQVETVEELLRKCPGTTPDKVAAHVKATMESVHGTLERSNANVEKTCSNSFTGAGSSSSAKAESIMRQTFRANAIRKAMNGLQVPLQEASLLLSTLISTLTTVLIAQDVVEPKLDSLLIPGNVEVYRAAASTPGLPDGTHLNFNAKDAQGNPCTPEAMLKASILAADSTSTVTAAAGTITSAHGVVGMAGVGKTIALQALSFDKDIQARFHDGILYFALGQGASLSTAIDAIAKIMRLTWASTSVSAVERSSLLQDAVDYAVAWFRGKICLFLVDDLWLTTKSETGFLHDLRQILRSCPQSRMATTTRSRAIANAAGRKVDFSAREPLGAVSVSIFMMHATNKAPQEPTGDMTRSIARILTICAGLPIALAVCGSTVALLAEDQRTFEGACDAYAVQLERKRTEVGEMQNPGGSSLNSGIILSLAILEAEFVQLKSRNDVELESTMDDLYTRLCVLRHQAQVPVSVLSCIWQVDNDFGLEIARLLNKMSLCKLRFVGNEGSIMLHDLQLDFCKRQAEAKKTSSSWHGLSGYTQQLSNEKGDSFEHALLAHALMSWRSVLDDKYSRRLSFSYKNGKLKLFL